MIQPDILLILTDQHRLSALGAYGEAPCRTPNLDRLAAEGTLIEQAYTTCPVCTPARGSVLTGQYPHAHGMRLNEDRRGRKLARSADADTDYNIYYWAADRSLGRKTLEKQQRDGVDAHSPAVDSLLGMNCWGPPGKGCEQDERNCT